MSLEESKAKKFARTKEKKTQNSKKLKIQFSVIYYITYFHNENWIPNGIDIQEISPHKEQEILFQPFSFFILKDVKIETEKRKASIYLENIGKKEILEKAIQKGKKVQYNKDLSIIEPL